MTRLAPILLVLLLAACAAKEPPPAIAYDGAAFHPATIAPEPPRPVEVVEIPTPLPLPGQLQPRPEPDKRKPTMRVAAANRAALQEPSAYGYINAIQVYPYSEGALYRLYAAPEQVSDIALEPGEQLTAVSAGDTVRWVIGDTSSGTGESKRVHVLVKPFAPGLRTNLIITTDRRFYHLQLESTVRTSMTALTDAARRTIAEHETLVLSDRDRAVFFDALVNSPAPNERLQRAFAEHRRRVVR